MIRRTMFRIVRRNPAWMIMPVLAVQMTSCISSPDLRRSSGIQVAQLKTQEESCEDELTPNRNQPRSRMESYYPWDETHLGVFDWFRDVIDRSQAWQQRKQQENCVDSSGDSFLINRTKSVGETNRRFAQNDHFAANTGKRYVRSLPSTFCSTKGLTESRKHRYFGYQQLTLTRFRSTCVAHRSIPPSLSCRIEVIHQKQRKTTDKPSIQKGNHKRILFYSDGFGRVEVTYRSFDDWHISASQFCNRTDNRYKYQVNDH